MCPTLVQAELPDGDDWLDWPDPDGDGKVVGPGLLIPSSSCRKKLNRETRVPLVKSHTYLPASAPYGPFFMRQRIVLSTLEGALLRDLVTLNHEGHALSVSAPPPIGLTSRGTTTLSYWNNSYQLQARVRPLIN
jgi:hypothetical protein